MGELWRSAAYRIAFVYSAAFALAIAVLGAIVFVAADAAFRHQQAVALADETKQLVVAYRGEGLSDLLDALAARSDAKGIAAFGYAMFDRDGQRIAGDLDTPPPPPGLHDIHFRDPEEGQDAARAMTTILPSGERLVVAIDTEGLEQIDRTILGLFIGAFGIVVMVGIAGALILGAYLRRRLSRIEAAARAIVGGDLTRRVAVSERGDEFDALGATLNAMLDRIEQLMENLRQVSSDIAHDLRTPLSRLRTTLEAAREKDPVGQRKAIDEAVTQGDALLSLFGGILRIAEVEGSTFIAFEPVDVTALVDDICEACTPAVDDGHRSLSCQAAPGMTVKGDRELLAQAIINLLDNAQAHTPVGTAITITAFSAGGKVCVRVADNGPGIMEQDRERVTRRFVRLDPARSSAGHGLGLNLVAAVAKSHGGHLVLEDAHPGLAATLVFPELIR